MDPQTLRLLDRLLDLSNSWALHQSHANIHLGSIANISSQRRDTLSFSLPSPQTPQLLSAFPTLLPRLALKQSRALETAHEALAASCAQLTRTVAAMSALRRDAFSKAGKAGMDGVAIEAAGWIDVVVGGYEREMRVREELMCLLEEGVGEVEGVRVRWARQGWVDFEVEEEVRERVKLARAAEKRR
ncbi:hypothetical protein BDK51DRAFT_46848 [Blyttiomyces helicus]|uniref:Uncharacterized protein n=1 Tax=Blyttiomyces helicus TaxID=388810 RepID=A0A4P9WGT3_9FUNG|nr:hypothetical protein BDK51DRAFT_46848 [Blyttiomyces helicus]|eukprot:RKO89716.1 hypothetical protein BDK51DRAFT_46848 [Blyttiomyces helicus]